MGEVGRQRFTMEPVPVMAEDDPAPPEHSDDETPESDYEGLGRATF